MNADRKTDSRLADDLFWQQTLEELQLGPDLEELEREARQADRSRATTWERVETLVEGFPFPLRFGLITVTMLAGACVLAAGLSLGKELLILLGTGLPSLLGDRPLEFHASIAHVVALAMILVVLLSSRAPRAPEGLVAQRAWSQFRAGWSLLWFAWMALYVWMTAYWGLRGETDTGFWSRWGPPVADLFNVLSSFVFFYLFLVLDRPSVKAEGLPQRDRAFRRSLFSVGTICASAALLSILGRLGYFQLMEFGPTIGSILVATSMAFFVGRLSDSHLKVKRSLLAPLYFYVALQMLWHLSVMAGAQHQLANALVLFGALVLKVYLFALLTRWIQDGKLQTYFDEVAFPRLPSDLE